MEYILTKNAAGQLQITRNGQVVEATDVLAVYPDRRVFALRGNMGVGKTTFTKQLCEIGAGGWFGSGLFLGMPKSIPVASKDFIFAAICEEMGCNDIVNSPTFAIVNVYEDAHGSEIYHFDCYRLKNLGEALNLGAEEYLYSGNYCFIEWPEVIEDLLPDNTVNLLFTELPDGTRRLAVE